MKGFTLSLVLKVKRFGTRKWPVVRLVCDGEILTQIRVVLLDYELSYTKLFVVIAGGYWTWHPP